MRSSALLFAMLAPLSLARGESPVELEGSLRSFALLSKGEQGFGPFKQEVDEALSLNRARLGLRAWLGESLEFQIALDGASAQGGGMGQSLALGRDSDLRLRPLSQEHLGDNYQGVASLDRLYLLWGSPHLEIRLGRQAIGHGSERLFNTTDLFAPPAGYDLDTEYKRGVDALRLILPLGDLSELELMAVGHDGPAAEALYLLRARSTFGGIDLSLLAGSSYAEASLGLDLQGELGGSGWYAGFFSRPGLRDESLETLRGTLGLSHKWRDLSITAEAHYNGAGEAKREDYLKTHQRLEYQVSEAAFMGKLYGGLALDYEWSALIHPSLAWFQNALDGSTLLAPGLRWDLGQETTLQCGAMLGLGEDESEFGMLPQLYHGSLRVYF